MSNSFNRAATEKETELDTVQAKNVQKTKGKYYIEIFAKNIDIKFIFTYLMIGCLHKELFFCSNFDKEFYIQV